ncbi:MAG: selenocysteine-specific elongation factor [Verrucomicrobiota bacterium]
MSKKHFIVGTAGHVDHGKSALVKALTGTDPDRLPEEKARKITIDLGFAHLDLPTPDSQPSALSVSIIDVPGHEDFVRNMIAGVGSIDAALLVVAADDGWMPQTEEHLQILEYLGVDAMIVALNKSDLGNVDGAIAQITQRLQGSVFANAAIIPVSARRGTGIDELRTAIASTLAKRNPQRDVQKPRLFVDRAFSVAGTGTVVTGSLSGGTLAIGQTVYIQPDNFKTRVRSIQSHHSTLHCSEPGMRTAVGLSDLPKTTSDKAIHRGNMVTGSECESSAIIDVLLQRSARLTEHESAARPLKSGASVHVHYGTARIAATVVLLEEEALEIGKRTIAQLRLAAPVVAFLADRFVLRDRSEQHTIAGGIVLDPKGQRESFRSFEQRRLLLARTAAPGDVDTVLASEIARRGPAHLDILLRQSHFSTKEILAAAARLQSRRQIVVHGEIACDAQSWAALKTRAIGVIDEAHKKNTERAGIDLNELRAALRNLAPGLFEALIADLCSDGFARKGSIIARGSHSPALPPHLDAIAKQILTTLSQKPFEPPARKQIATDLKTGQVLRYLMEQGLVVEIAADLVLSAEAFARAKEIIVSAIAQDGAATASELRQALQTSRRIIVPLLERLDRDRITRRDGDRRTLPDQPGGTSSSRPASSPGQLRAGH